MGKKLIRDNYLELEWEDPELKKFVRRVHNVQEHKTLLGQKVFEELGEVFAATSKTELAEELADLMEVLEEYAWSRGILWSEVTIAKDKKLEEFGGFEDGIVWEM